MSGESDNNQGGAEDQPPEGQHEGNGQDGGQQPAGGQQAGQPQGQPRGGQVATGQGQRQPAQQNEVGGYQQDELVDFAKFGAVVYGGISIGTFVTLFLTFSLASEDSIINPFSQNSDEELFAAAASGYELLLLVAGLLAVAFAIHYYLSEEVTGPTYTPAATVAVVGTLVAGVVLLLLMLIFQPDTADIGLGDELPAIIGAVIGVAITGGLVGFGLDNYE